MKVGFRHLVVMVKVKERGSGMQYVIKCPRKDVCEVCVSVCVRKCVRACLCETS